MLYYKKLKEQVISILNVNYWILIKKTKFCGIKQMVKLSFIFSANLEF